MTSPSETAALDTAWSDDDIYLEEELHGRPPRAKLGRLALVLAGVLLATGGFYAGVRVEKSKAKGSSGSSALSALAARFRNGTGGAAGGAGAGGGAGGAGGGAGSGALVGTITLIDGQNIYVTDSSGNVVKVVTTPSSQFSITSSGTVQQLHPGDTVVVTGPTDANGNVTASNVRDGGTGFGGGGGRTRGGTGGAGGAASGGAGGGAGGGTAGGGGGGGFGGGGPPGD